MGRQFYILIIIVAVSVFAFFIWDVILSTTGLGAGYNTVFVDIEPQLFQPGVEQLIETEPELVDNSL